MPLNPGSRIPALGLAVTVIATAGSARADDRTDCLRAASKGQTLRDEHQLIEARAQFRVCARQVCPAVVRRDCATWLDAAERSLPTVVVSARDAGGTDLVDVTVRVDGAPLATRLDGRAVAMNPGPHVFHFQEPDGTSVHQTIVIDEGRQDQSVAVVFPGPPAVAAEVPREPAPPVPAEAPPPPSPPRATPTSPNPALPPSTPEASASSPLRPIGWVLGAFGLAGLGAGTVLGVVAVNDKNAAACDPGGYCDAGRLRDARTAATGSTIAFIAGGTLFATGAALVLFAPRSEDTSSAAITAAPLLGTNVGGIDVRGSF
jgi:hypothetical protein